MPHSAPDASTRNGGSPEDIAAAEPMPAEDVAAFAAAARDQAAALWPAPTALSGGGLDTLWTAAARQGWLELAGAGALAAATALARELGRLACPLPVLDAYVASRVFAAETGLVKRIAAGAVRVAAAVDGGADFGEAAAGGAPLLDAPGATHVLVLPLGAGTAELRPVIGTDPLPGLAAPDWQTARTGPAEASTELAAQAADEAVSLLRLQLAVRALAAAERAHEMAVEHACQRKQFGTAIGAFGAVQQRTAACQIDVSAGNLLIADAVRAFEAAGADRLTAAEIAVEHARAAAPRVQLGAHHTLAAVGYFEEHGAPWLFRRVHGDTTRLQALPRAAGEVADVLVEGGGSLPATDLGEAGEAFRAEVRTVLAEHAATRTSLMAADTGLTAAMAERGWFGMAWPQEDGGRGATLPEQVVLNEECAYHRAAVTKPLSAVMLLGNSILKHGTQEQKDTFLPLIREGKLGYCLGYSEPEAGSDLASLRTSAVRDGGDWVVNGQKLWTTGGHEADWVWLAVRTGPDATPRHAGITVFLVPMDTPGITVQQHRALSGEISCSVFYDGVRVPDSRRIGEVNGGWKVITDALAGERITMGNIAASLHRQLDDLLAAVRAGGRAQAVGPRGSAKRALIGELAVGIHGARALVAEAIRATAAGRGARLEAPMAGVYGGELAERFGEAVLDILGPSAALSAGVPGVPGGGTFEYGLRMSIMYVVGGGTNDIQRAMIARGLGLPRK